MFLFFGGLPKKKCTRRAQGLCFFVFGASRKNYRRAQGCVFPFLMLQKNKSNRRAQGLCFLLLWCFHTKKKSNRRAQGLWFCFFWGCKKTNPIGGHKGCVFAFLVLSEKTNPIGGHKGCVFGFCGASKKKQIQYEGRD